MEVHHPHHVTHKKKWGEYLLEFFMLFLAVFLGFVAENIRETSVEHSREKEYVHSLIEDLQVDTMQLAANINLRQNRSKMIDSLVFLLSSPDAKNNGNTIYYFARSISPPIYFFPNERTIQQLKNSGSLRLIRNIPISNKIMGYDQKMRNFLFVLTDEIYIRSEYRELARKIFNGKVFSEMIRDNKIKAPVNNPALYSDNAALINEYIGEVQYLKNANKTQARREEELMEQANHLIALIKKEYHLENK